VTRALVVALCLVVAAGCGGGSGDGTRAAGTESDAAGAPAAGGRLDEYRGKPVIANVWASW
jgi:hypothetical protein